MFAVHHEQQTSFQMDTEQLDRSDRNRGVGKNHRMNTASVSTLLNSARSLSNNGTASGGQQATASERVYHPGSGGRISALVAPAALGDR